MPLPLLTVCAVLIVAICAHKDEQRESTTSDAQDITGTRNAEEQDKVTTEEEQRRTAGGK